MGQPPCLGIKVFADGADLEGIQRLSQNPLISGFTTNPTLMRKAGVEDYEGFSRSVLEVIGGRPVSFEVFTDDFDEMRVQARYIGSWGDNVYVKVPVTNTNGESTMSVVRDLSADGVKVNVTAILSLAQVVDSVSALDESDGAVVSVFAGRIADTGRDPVPLMTAALDFTRQNPAIELLWASPREILNVRQAAALGCDIITVTHDLLAKLGGLGRSLEDVSLDTVRMFYSDAASAGYCLNTANRELELVSV